MRAGRRRHRRGSPQQTSSHVQEIKSANGHLRRRRRSSSGNSPPRRARAKRLDELGQDDRPQEDRGHVHGHDLRVLHPGRDRGAHDAPPAGGPEQHAGHAPDLQPARDDARDDDDLPVRRADDGRPGQLLPAAHGRSPRHGLPAPERALLLAAARGRDRLLRVDLLEPAGSRLDQLSAARRNHVFPGRRPGRLDLPDPPHRPVLDPRRDQLLRHARQHAREGPQLGQAAAVHVGHSHVLGAFDLRASGDRRGGHDDAHGQALRDALLRPGRRRRGAALAALVLVLRPPRGLHHGPARLRPRSRRSCRYSRENRFSATKRSRPRPSPSPSWASSCGHTTCSRRPRRRSCWCS